MNKVMLLGVVCEDMERGERRDGTSMLWFSVREEHFGREQTHKVVIWGNFAKAFGRVAHPGALVYIEGMLNYSKGATTVVLLPGEGTAQVIEHATEKGR